MSLKPIDSEQLKDYEESSEAFSQGATSFQHYEKMKSSSRGGSSGRIGSHAEPRHSNKALIIVVVVAIAAVLIGAGIFFARQFAGTSGDDLSTGVVEVTIPSGYGTGDIVQLLQSAGVISSTTDFVTAARNAGASGSLKAGTYQFSRGASNTEIINSLVAGPETSAIALTIPEGLTVDQTAARVEEVLGIPVATFVMQAKASTYVTDFPFLSGAYNDSLEGFLFPETYFFDDGVTADTVIRAMLRQYETTVGTVDYSKATQGNITLDKYQVLILASLIERETAISSERPIVSSVVYNRLNAEPPMPLQIDAAIAYALGKTGLLTEADLQVDSPYNVYTNLGLPPGPICSPSAESIKAAASPDQTGFFYYVASAALDGTHVFCENYDQFLEARNQYNAAMGIG